MHKTTVGREKGRSNGPGADAKRRLPKGDIQVNMNSIEWFINQTTAANNRLMNPAK